MLNTFKTFFKTASTLLVLFAFSTSTVFAQTNAMDTPDGMVKQVVNSVIDTINADPVIQSGKLDRIIQLVNEKIVPHIDFKKTTQITMGRFWKYANAQQQQKLTEQYTQLLIHTYAGALVLGKGQKVKFKPLHGLTATTKDVVVQSQITLKGEPAQLDYRIMKSASGEWKVYDINVLGVWLIQTYRPQFADRISSASSPEAGVADLLKFLEQRNQELTSKK